MIRYLSANENYIISGQVISKLFEIANLYERERCPFIIQQKIKELVEDIKKEKYPLTKKPADYRIPEPEIAYHTQEDIIEWNKRANNFIKDWS